MLSLQELRKAEWEMTKARGGVWEVTEGDWWQNKISRNLVRAYRREHGKCFMGNINEHFIHKDKPILEEYTGGMVYNFGCNFIVPEENQELIQLIKDYRNTPYQQIVPKIKAINNKVTELKGLHLNWV